MRKFIRTIVSSLLVFCAAFLCLQPAYAQPEQNEVTETTLAITGTKEFLQFSENCRLDSYSQNLTVTLEADIDLTDTAFVGIPIFNGKFDGKGHIIKGLNISCDGSNLGLFRYVTQTAIVYDLRIEGHVTPGGSRGIIGGIAGCNSGKIENCVFSGTVSGSEITGGIVGHNQLTGIIVNCSVEGSIFGNHFVGGITGKNNGVIRNCDNFANINTTPQQNSVEIEDITMETLTNSESASTVTDIGGIAGISSGVIRQCKNTGDVGYRHMGYNIGGIAGTQSGLITECKNYGSISGRKEVGGVCGQQEPVATLEYSVDTLQILRQQMETLSTLTDRATAHAQSNTANIRRQLALLEDHGESAEDAIDQLLVALLPSESGEPTLPDPDKLQAAQNALSESLLAMSTTASSLATSVQQTTDTLIKDMQAIGDQVDVMNDIINNASDHLGAGITDISDADTNQDLTGKISNSANHGAILADLNAGGIVGAISFENDLDPESDLQIIGDNSLNFEGQLRSVVLSCQNFASVTAKKQNAGGIIGWQTMGLVKSCLNIGTMDCPGASHIGGIAGNSSGYIRSCSSTCVLSGDTTMGGIAGSACIATDCRSMVQLKNGREKLGAVLGVQVECSYDIEIPISENCYLPIGPDPGAIDGISYAGLAQALETEEFLALDNLESVFRESVVTFIFADGSKKFVTVKTGQPLTAESIPALAQKKGYMTSWHGLTELNGNGVFFNTTLTAVYTPLCTTLKSETCNEKGLPILLLEGIFLSDAPFTLEPSTSSPVLKKGQQFCEGWKLYLPDSQSTMTARYLIPVTISNEQWELWAFDENECWQLIEYTIDGSYAVFSINEEATALAAVSTRQVTWYWYAAGCFVLLLLIMCILIAKRRKTK